MQKQVKPPIGLKEIRIRTIEEKDNKAIAEIIRESLREFGVDRPGTVYYDQSTDFLFELFRAQDRAIYFVAELHGQLVGGAGIYPSPGLPADTAELVKMYLCPEVRGIGLGRMLIQNCFDFAGSVMYKNIYLETMPELKQALKTYEKFGFEYLDGPMGNTGHFGCDRWMLKRL